MHHVEFLLDLLQVYSLYSSPKEHSYFFGGINHREDASSHFMLRRGQSLKNGAAYSQDTVHLHGCH